jgi:hypothetical protein
MKVALVTSRKHGLETWLVLVNGTVLYSFMGEAAARTAYKRLLQKLAVSA